MKRLSSWYAFVSALLGLAAFGQHGFGPIVLVALVPLLLRLGDSDVRPFRCGYGFGLVYGFGQLFWIAQLTLRWTHSIALAAVPLVIATALMAVYFGLAGWLIHRCWNLDLPWMIPVVWAGVEVFRSYIPVLAFPWGLLASPLWRYPSDMQSAHYLTIFGVSALAVLLNTAVAVWIRERRYAKVNPLAVAFACIYLTPLLISMIPAHARKMRVTAGQPGIDLAFSDPHVADIELAPNIRRLESDALRSDSDLLVLPEGLIQTGARMPPTLPFPVSPRLPIVFGGQRGDEAKYQSAFGYDGSWTVADKTRLVIFGEFVPRWIPFLQSFNLPTGDLSAGDRVQSLKVGRVTVGPLLCFEALFPDIAYRQMLNGSQVLAVMSMDDWFMGSLAPDQLRAAAVWRAIETGRPLVRAATTGYSFICDSHGQMLAQAGLGGPAAITHEIEIPDISPAWWLPVFPFVALLACVLVGILRPSPSTNALAGPRQEPEQT